MADAPQTLWLPPSAKKASTDGSKKVLLGIVGESGSGKSHGVYQLAHDDEWGPENLLVLMSEDSTATYDSPVNFVRVQSLQHLEGVVAELVEAKRRNHNLPTVVWDSMNGTTDYTFMNYEKEPILSERQKRDKLAEYGRTGELGMAQMIKLRDLGGVDVVVNATTFEGAGRRAEFAIRGNMIPENFTRLTGVCLHLKTEKFTYDPTQTVVKEAPHRVIGRDDKGEPNGVYIDRFYYTQDDGEVHAKGHHNLAMKERAYLPDILRKIHGRMK